MESAAAGASRSVGAAHRRLGRVGLLTPMRAAPPRGRGAGQSTGRTTPISAAISTARAESGARRAPRARVSRERVVNAANFSSDFSSASRERASGADGRRTGRCARRPPSWRRSIGTVTSGRAAVASSSPRPHPAFARSPERHRPPRTECPPWRIGGSRREPLGRRGAPAAGAGRSAHADARRAPSRPRRGPEHRENNTNFSSNFNSASRVRGSPRPSRARRRSERVVNAANFSSDFSSASRERASGADGRRTGRCARRPPSWRRSIGTVTSGRAAVASSSPRPHPAFARSPERHRQPRTECPPWNRRQPARAARSARRTGGWGGSVCSRRCAPRPLGQSTGRTTPISAAISTARAESGARRAPRARVSRERVVNAANFSSDFSSASERGLVGRTVAEPGVAHVDRLAGGARSAPSPAAAPRSPHPLRGLIQRSLDRPSAIGRPAPNARHGIGGSRREPLGRRGAPAAGAGRSAHADARRAPSRPRRGQSTGRTTPISAAISTARAESGARRAPRARA